MHEEIEPGVVLHLVRGKYAEIISRAIFADDQRLVDNDEIIPNGFSDEGHCLMVYRVTDCGKYILCPMSTLDESPPDKWGQPMFDKDRPAGILESEADILTKDTYLHQYLLLAVEKDELSPKSEVISGTRRYAGFTEKRTEELVSKIKECWDSHPQKSNGALAAMGRDVD